MSGGRQSISRSNTSWKQHPDGTVEVMGSGGLYQVKIMANSWGGPSVISVYSPDDRVSNFGKLNEAIGHLKGKGVSSQNLRRLHQQLPNRLKGWQSKEREYEVDRFGYKTKTDV
jgi:hypothetical protein